MRMRMVEEGMQFFLAIASYLIALERRMGHLLSRKARSQMYDYPSYIIKYLP